MFLYVYGFGVIGLFMVNRVRKRVIVFVNELLEIVIGGMYICSIKWVFIFMSYSISFVYWIDVV